MTAPQTLLAGKIEVLASMTRVWLNDAPAHFDSISAQREGCVCVDGSEAALSEWALSNKKWFGTAGSKDDAVRAAVTL
ncbi:hypothetical protein EDD52_102196 [Primorskyibacter sedentarius]|uniref:Uncharacterized protein n=1 Tax=Primorskyibacter sedentarius TaxID=745311 RepID=A0A4R3JJN8_9RHOB|nr:hypothetical protein [Primorskyibacter sedentarius]TCS66379.1 hypothetical protein EDD52_102196 [Primorskyibacter sedentarius]